MDNLFIASEILLLQVLAGVVKMPRFPLLEIREIT
jgi:hypothetical protein